MTDYLNRLKQYDTVLMGRKTYEFEYEFGLKPGERAYSHMEHFVFSRTLRFDTAELNVVNPDRMDVIQQIKEAKGGQIYLCGGGTFAHSLLEHELIDQLVVKLNPVIFCTGIRVFEDSSKQVGPALRESKSYGNGVILLKYDVNYG